MTYTRQGDTYHWRGYVSRCVARSEAADMRSVLQMQIESYVESEGYVPLPDTFDVHFHDPLDPAESGQSWSDEDRKMSEKWDSLTTLMSIGYRTEGAS